MKKLMSIHYNAFSFNTAMLVLRLALGILMMSHGYAKLVDYNGSKSIMYNFLNLGISFSLILCIFAEFFCSLFIMIGLFTRAMAVPLIINMLVIIFKVHAHDFFGTAERGSLYLAGFLVLLLCGPGKVSVDGVASK